MSNYNKKVVTDALELYRLHNINVLYRKESINAFNANSDFAIELGKLNNFLINTKLTRMSLTKRISYRAFVYTKMNELYTSAYKKLIMDKAVYEKFVSYTQSLYEKSIDSELNLHYANTNWKFVPPCIYRMYLRYILRYIIAKVSKKQALEFEETMG
nr:MAG TPA: hypothetical protein [Caudoviricetes sp.]DAE39859.1 MAG TPA: hypothetical protein [Caudoviricetes sp.]